MDKKVKELINDQINKEFYSAYLYLDFSNYYYEEGLNGFGNWYKVQAQEERDHAMLMLQYLQNNGETVTLEAIAKPDVKLSSHLDPLKEGAKHDALCDGADQQPSTAAGGGNAKDFRTMQFLDWFIKEQGEEEKNADEMIKKYELFGGEAKGLYMLDSELAARVYTAPSLVL